VYEPRKTSPAFVPIGHILSLQEAALIRIDEIVVEAGKAAVTGDTQDPQRFAAALAPYVEEVAHLRYMMDFLADRASGSFPDGGVV